MDLSFLNEYMVPVIVGICLCVGYILKNLFPKFDNRYFPAGRLAEGRQCLDPDGKLSRYESSIQC